LAICLIVGTVTVVDLRVLGVIMPDQPVKRVAQA